MLFLVLGLGVRSGRRGALLAATIVAGLLLGLHWIALLIDLFVAGPGAFIFEAACSLVFVTGPLGLLLWWLVQGLRSAAAPGVPAGAYAQPGQYWGYPQQGYPGPYPQQAYPTAEYPQGLVPAPPPPPPPRAMPPTVQLGHAPPPPPPPSTTDPPPQL